MGYLLNIHAISSEVRHVHSMSPVDSNSPHSLPSKAPTDFTSCYSLHRPHKLFSSFPLLSPKPTSPEIHAHKPLQAHSNNTLQQPYSLASLPLDSPNIRISTHMQLLVMSQPRSHLQPNPTIKPIKYSCPTQTSIKSLQQLDTSK